MDKVSIRYSASVSLFILSALIILLSDCGCSSKSGYPEKIGSPDVDTLIKIKKVDDNTILVYFGWDAVTAVKTSEGIVVIDGGISTLLTSRYRRIIEKYFNRKDFLYVINTHGHHDHIRGNSIFPEAKVTGHRNSTVDSGEEWQNKDSILMRISKIIDDYDERVQKTVIGSDEWFNNYTQEIRYIGEYLDIRSNVRLRPPDITFSDSMKLDCGDTSFEMIYFGKSHSNSDILIYIPEAALLFTGDLFSKYGRPGWSNSSTGMDENRSKLALKWINKRINEIETIIDGHGQILTIDDLKSFNNIILMKYSGDN